MTTKTNKYEYVWILQSNWGKWEDITEEDTYKDGRAQLKCYRENEPQVAHRLICRRVLRDIQSTQLNQVQEA